MSNIQETIIDQNFNQEMIIVRNNSQTNKINENNQNKKNVIIIGSGFGGLSAAIRLQAQGYQVSIFERRDQIGGRASVDKLDGFTFDAGPTVISGQFLIEELFILAGKNMYEYVDLLPVFPYYRIFFDDKTFFDYADPNNNIRNITEFSPEDVKGYKQMITDVQPIFERGFHEMSFKPFDSFASMLKIAPALFSLKSYLTNYKFVSKYIKNEK